jgi:hypothetical protein
MLLKRGLIREWLLEEAVFVAEKKVAEGLDLCALELVASIGH